MEVALTVVVLAQTGLIWYILNSQKEERAKMLNAIVAKDAQELTVLNQVDKIKPEKPIKIDPDASLVENLPDDEFNKFLERANRG